MCFRTSKHQDSKAKKQPINSRPVSDVSTKKSLELTSSLSTGSSSIYPTSDVPKRLPSPTTATSESKRPDSTYQSRITNSTLRPPPRNNRGRSSPPLYGSDYSSTESPSTNTWSTAYSGTTLVAATFVPTAHGWVYMDASQNTGHHDQVNGQNVGGDYIGTNDGHGFGGNSVGDGFGGDGGTAVSGASFGGGDSGGSGSD